MPITRDRLVVEEVLDVLALVPAPVWGRDELRAGEMWNSNSVIAWALTHAGLCDRAGAVPGAGRAPGWRAGTVVARSQGPLPGASRRVTPPPPGAG